MQRVAPKVRAWLASTDQLANDIHTAAGKPIGRVRLGILPSAAHPLVSTLCRRLQERYPLVQLSVREGQGAQLETWLEDGSLDLAILFRHTVTPRNGDVYLVETPTYLVSADGDALTAKSTVPFPKLHQSSAGPVLSPQQLARSPGRDRAERGVTFNVALEADSLALQTHMVAGGGMYALLGAYAVGGSQGAALLQSRSSSSPRQASHRARDVATRGAHARVPHRDARDAGHREQVRGREGGSVT